MLSNHTTLLGYKNSDSDKRSKETRLNPKIDKKTLFKTDICWRNVAILGYYHLAGLYGFYLVFTSAKVATTIFAIFLYIVGDLGILAGSHRLYAHRAYKAKWPLRLLLVIMDTIAFEGGVYQWAREHRVHHKFSETDADPHNATRGFFFSHMGWLLLKKHPDVTNKGKGVDMSDLLEDPIVRFQKRYYWPLLFVISFILPTFIPMRLWNETLSNAYHVAVMFRVVISHHSIWLVNSAAHAYGNKPYDRDIYPAENKIVSILSMGEGWHNYHHTFPWDYKASELGFYKFNFATAFIDFFALIGWAYDLKIVPQEMIEKRASRSGDGSHAKWGSKQE
ncbi:hypothetical protein QAD02_015933 [Eretmocerus hayati]|uniref:Uncharacterized protein n=1 Tax=Eretmocerus hayati TaxID=131215 RepID=A0ACC2PAY2_9HYME|nr:hypothetical protein QAD02_015933 [Eretmocerus hayati]